MPRLLLLCAWAAAARAMSVALLTVATADVLERYATALNSKRCYAEKHGVAYVLDTNPYQVHHGFEPHWNRVAAIQRLMPLYDWVVYMDADMLVTNSTPSLKSMIEDTWVDGGFPHIIIQDGMEINNGMFMLRSSAWSWQFLEDWLELGGSLRGQEITASVKDQAAMQELLLRHANAHRGPDVTPVDTCAFVRQEMRCYTQFSSCWRVRMAELGFPLGRRSNPDVHYWHTDNHAALGVRGFNMMYPFSITAAMLFTSQRFLISTSTHSEMFFGGWWYSPSRLWAFGDFAVHRVNERRGGAAVNSPRAAWPPHVAAVFDPHFGFRRCPDTHWVLGMDPPFPPDVFGRNMWDGYVEPPVRYERGTPGWAASGIDVVPLTIGVDGHRANMEVPHRNLSVVQSRFFDVLLLEGIKCAGDFIKAKNQAQLLEMSAAMEAAVAASLEEMST